MYAPQVHEVPHPVSPVDRDTFCPADHIPKDWDLKAPPGLAISPKPIERPL